MLRTYVKNGKLGSEKPTLEKSDYFPFEEIRSIYKNGKPSNF